MHLPVTIVLQQNNKHRFNKVTAYLLKGIIHGKCDAGRPLAFAILLYEKNAVCHMQQLVCKKFNEFPTNNSFKVIPSK